MNINLTPASDTPKMSTASSQSVGSSEEAKPSEGFFSKLAAFIKGESGGEKVSDAESMTVESAVGEEEAGDGKSVSADEDEVLESGEVITKGTKGSSTDELLAIDQEQNKPASKVKVETEASTKSQSNDSTEGDAEKIVSENGELLGRLNKASKVLQPKDGNELPQQPELATQEVSSSQQQKAHNVSEEEQAETLNTAASAVQRQTQGETQTDVDVTDTENKKSIKAQEHLMAEQSVEQQVMVPESAKRFIESEDGQEAVTASDNPGDDELVVAAAGAVALMAGVTERNSDKAQLTSPEIEQLKHELKTQGLSDKEIEQIVEAARAEAQAQITVVQGNETNQTEPVKPNAEKKLQSNASPSQLAGSEVVTESAIEPTVAATAVSGSSAIPWAVSAADVGVDELQIQPDAKPKAQQAAVAQSVQQALHTSSAQVTAAQHHLQATQQAAAVPLPNELAASQLQQVASTPIVSEQAMLKAVMGAKAAGAVGKLAATDGKQGASQSSDTGFAQQLSQAASQQGLTAQNPTRTEQAAAQAPLQLNREMAGDQVAERVQMMMSKNLKNIDIRLDPPELGRLQIRMNMTGEGATVHFTVANQQARDVIEQSMPRLREMLAQQGVQLGDSSVQQQSAGQQQNRYAAGSGAGNGQGSSNQAFIGEENLELDVNLDLNVATKRDGISYYA
ncbi:MULTISPECIES: flagellar hook-length control protein FliK [Vibrio]|uniref:flagellar hook-length control protein FliK n=1 Tax=Vibrio TaxID=662 RepID=UPI0020759743|nr:MULTISPECIES: flagellar hook-length control protein FliK [Vibrio]USD33260.1 flagellar hook-length control protein FliK [Vibrio sp. SCSIO 43186]USD46330.1 flagellar hook-length control protein FliK [Vibrio sp. SCSIO 43145]USD70384.1 flagellar hook-length control protein FliK [Vibrio sp. SCSIO 43139]USD95303.1 flagellar hook-length control protein FliK [Vibrio coralliilyticus]